MIVLYRPSTNEIIWYIRGPFFNQHDIDILDEKRISIFNNNYKNYADGNYIIGNNEIIIYDFESKTFSKYLQDAMSKYRISTKY